MVEMESQGNTSDGSCRCSFCEVRVLVKVMSSIFFIGGTVVAVYIIQNGYDPLFAVVVLCLVAAILYVMVIASNESHSKETYENKETGECIVTYSRKDADVSDVSTQTNLSHRSSQSICKTSSSSACNGPIQECSLLSCVTCRRLRSYCTESARQPPKMWMNTQTSLRNNQNEEVAITSPIEMIRGKQNLQSTVAMDHRRYGNSFLHKIPHRSPLDRATQWQPYLRRPHYNAAPVGTSREPNSTDTNWQKAAMTFPQSFPIYGAVQNPSSAAFTSGNFAVRTLQQNLKAEESARISGIDCRDLCRPMPRELFTETAVHADSVLKIPTEQEERRCTAEFQRQCNHLQTAQEEGRCTAEFQRQCNHLQTAQAASTTAELWRCAQSGIATNATTETQHRLSRLGIETMRKLSHDPETFLDAIATCQDLAPAEWRAAWELRRQGVSFEQTTRILGLWF